MANARINQLEGVVAHYEDIMSKCRRCKTSLPARETAPAPRSSDRDRLPTSDRRPAAEVPPPPPKPPQNQPLPVNKKSQSTRPSKQPTTASNAYAHKSDGQQYTSGLERRRPSGPSRQAVPPPPSHTNRPSASGLSRPDVSVSMPRASETPRQPESQPQTRPSLLSSDDLRLASTRRQHSGQLIDIGLQGSYSRHSKTGKEDLKRWMRTAELMMEDVPLGREWQEALSKKDSSVLAAVVMDSALITEGDLLPQKADDKIEQLVRLVRGFARRHSEGRIIFEEFILVCMCNVLSDRGVPQDEIVQTLQICISDTSKKNVLRYLRGSVWVNELINDLFFTEWSYRAVDLIVLWNRPISTYGGIASPPGSYQYFISRLTQSEYHDGYHELPHRTYDTIPWIVKKELGDEVSYVLDQDIEIHTYKGRYASICKALGYSEEFFKKTRHLHSSNSSDHGFSADDDSDDVASTSRSTSYQTAWQSISSAPNRRRPTSADKARSGPSSNASYLSDTSPPSRDLSDDDSPDDAAGSGPSTSQRSASLKPKRMMPDRSAKPLGDRDVRRREPPYVDPDTGELLVSTSLGASAPGTGSTKRPLPDSPTSPLQPDNTERRRQHEGETSSRGAMTSSSRSRKEHSHKQRGRA